MGHSTHCQLVLSWKSIELNMVSEPSSRGGVLGHN
ncbi:unnamed protein product, partial [Arabidopsis halleri]